MSSIERPLKIFFALFLTFQCLALSCDSYWFTFPDKEKVEWIRSPFKAYITATRQLQRWSMFTNKNMIRTIKPTVVAHDTSGRQVRVGGILPGLRQAEVELPLRVFVVFQRILYAKDKYLLNQYARQVCRALLEQKDFVAQQVMVHLEIERINGDEQILAGGKHTSIDKRHFGPVRCPRLR